tara:strand:- start:10758 stop:11774 length:1017 start_codon:yes stop_codon:yes gene_type:complete
MATLANTDLTLLDQAKRTDPDGNSARIVQMLSQSSPMIEDAVSVEGNLPTGTRVTIQTGLPTSYYKKLGRGTPSSKEQTVQVDENAAILISRSQVDEDTAELNGNLATLRVKTGKSFVESMGQTHQQTMIYGSAANPEEFVGLANRYSSLSAANGDNILDAGGSGSDNMSAYLIGFGEDTIYTVFPKGSTAGISHTDLGLTDVRDSDGNEMRVYKDMWKLKSGLVVADWRYGVRIANIDVSDLIAKSGTQASTAATAVINLMSQSLDRIPNMGGSKLGFYVNRTLASHLRVIALDKSSSAVTIEPALNQFGKTIHQMMFLGVPVRLVDRLINTEARVV